MFLGSDWEDGLEKLATEVASKEFYLALIGAGAWSLPLGRRIKQMGKCEIHMGGEMQLLFGIKGKRWEDEIFIMRVGSVHLQRTHRQM